MFSGVCDEAMGMESYAIADNAITASSSKEGSEPFHARITGRSSWSPLDDDKSPYLEVKFPSLKRITSILTQGGENGEMVKRFSIQYIPEGEANFKVVTHKILITNPDGRVVEEEVKAQLSGNRNDHTIRENILDEAIVTKVIRILPIRQAKDQKLSLRIELRGCDETETASTLPYISETTTEVTIKTTRLPTTVGVSEEATQPIKTTTSQALVETTTKEVVTSTPVSEDTTTTKAIAFITTTTATEKITTEVTSTGKITAWSWVMSA